MANWFHVQPVSLSGLASELSAEPITLEILEDDGSYAIKIRPPQQVGVVTPSLPLSVDHDRLVELNEYVAGRLGNRDPERRLFRSEPFWNELKLEYREELLYELANVGHYLFTQVFPEKPTRHELTNLLEQVREKQAPLPVTIIVESNHFVLPWELLFPGDPRQVTNPEDYRQFWGWTYVISRIINDPRVMRTTVPTDIKVLDKPWIGLVTDDRLTENATAELNLFAEMKAADRIKLESLPPLNPNHTRHSETELFRFLNTRRHIFHFACHADIDEGTPDNSYLRVSTNFQVAMPVLREEYINLSNYPLVILNACDTANINARSAESFARRFYLLGAGGVVATDWAVPDAFAASFASQLYRMLLNQSQPNALGPALLATRQHFFDNPTALAYSMYARASTRLVSAV